MAVVVFRRHRLGRRLLPKNSRPPVPSLSLLISFADFANWSRLVSRLENMETGAFLTLLSSSHLQWRPWLKSRKIPAAVTLSAWSTLFLKETPFFGA